MELFASVASDPEVTRYMTWTPHSGVDETRRVITELFNVGNERTWLIELNESGEIIGSCGFRVDNTRSARVLERAGLSLEGRVVQHTVFPNIGKEPQDVLQFGKTVR